MSSILLLKSMLFASVLQKTKKQKKKIKAKKSAAVKSICPEICRVCNLEVGIVPIFKNCLQPNIANEIENFGGVRISKKDKLSKQLCQKCLDLLNGCITFREMCQRNNNEVIELSIKKETEINNYLEDTLALPESDDSFNIPSPEVSEDNNLEIWGCTACSKNFSDLDSYNAHFPECIENKQSSNKSKTPKEKTRNEFLCDICGKVTRSNANLIVHMSIHDNVFPFKCEECPYMGRTMDLLKMHKRSHLADKPFKCSQCPKSASSSSNLAKHVRHVHNRSRDFKCSYCDKAFGFRYDVKKHIRDIHLRQGTVECDICFKKFNTKSIHDNVFPFKCEECPYMGRTMDLLKMHKRSHLADKPFKCSQCPKSASSSSNLAKHVRHVHNRSRDFKCSYCDKAFGFRYDVKKHIRDIHLRQGTVECDICFKKFNTKKILQGHRVKIHKIKGDRHGRLPSYLQCQREQ